VFDAVLYQIEMSQLIGEASDRLRREHPDLVVYSVSIWTDPSAAASAVSFDTEAHSAAQVRATDEWASKHFRRLIAAGNAEEAQLFAPRPGARNANPADFYLREFATIEHRAFEPGWDTESGGRCWDELEPALIAVRDRALRHFAGLPLHPRAELAVNSSREWYDHPIELRALVT
jgi:hypothetical protein